MMIDPHGGGGQHVLLRASVIVHVGQRGRQGAAELVQSGIRCAFAA
jgi:hypothetical protein